MQERTVLLAAPALLLLAAAADGAEPPLRSGWGPRIGFTAGPGQIHLGAHSRFNDPENPLQY